MNIVIYFNIFIISIILLLIFIYNNNNNNNNNKEQFVNTKTSIVYNKQLDDLFKKVINNSTTYKTSLECVDDVIVTILESESELELENTNKNILLQNISEDNKVIRDFCNGKHYTSKQYLDKFLYLAEDKSAPNKVRKLHIKQLDNTSINISWFPPDSEQKEGDNNIRIEEHAIKKYICILKNNTKETVKMYISNSINNDKTKIVEHIIRGLIIGDNYSIYVLSENINGFGKNVETHHTQKNIINTIISSSNDNNNDNEGDKILNKYLEKGPIYNRLKILTN
jgi:hypothetical protein